MQVTTIEGLGAPGRVSALQAALLRHRAFQCGFCVPGFLASATEILGSGRRATAARSSESCSREMSAAAPATSRSSRRCSNANNRDRRPRAPRHRAGRFIADLAPDDCVEVCFVRSPVPHAVIRSVDLGSTEATWGAQLGLQPLRLEAGGMATVLWHPLPTERVRYVGEPVAMAWGEDRYAAEDLAEAVSVDYAPLPAGTPLHDAAPDGVLFSRSVDSGGLDEVMARAHLVLERTFKTARQSALPLEGRGVVAEHDEATGVTTVWTSTQLRTRSARRRPRVGQRRGLGAGPCSQVGGGFGLKASLYAEEIAVAALARGLGRPVRWIEDRTENLLAGTHGHDTRVWLRVAVGEDGRVHAIDADVVTDVGAYSVWPGTAVVEPATAALSLFGPYALEAIRFRARAVASNRCPVGPVGASARTPRSSPPNR